MNMLKFMAGRALVVFALFLALGTNSVFGRTEPGGPGDKTTEFSTNCALGFWLADEETHVETHAPSGGRIKSQEFTDWYVCSTNIIQCPKQPQVNGSTASVTPTPALQQIGAGPDGGNAKFRVQYRCGYDYTPIMEQ